jgi:hypothetical protein
MTTLSVAKSVERLWYMSEWVWSDGRTILTSEKWSTGRTLVATAATVYCSVFASESKQNEVTHTE